MFCARPILLLGALLGVAAAGCAPPPTPVPAPPPLRVSKLGSQYFSEAHDLWLDARRKDLSGYEWDSTASQIIALLEHAVEADPRSPLFSSMLGQFQLELGAGHEGQANQAFDHTHELTPYWPPYWIGKATLAVRRQDRPEAERLLTGAEASISELSLPPVDKQGALTTAQQRADLLEMLQKGEQWSPDGSWLAVRDIVSPGEAITRCRARIAFCRYQIAEMAGAPVAFDVKALEAVLAIEPDHLPARIHLSTILRIEGSYEAAEAQLVGYLHTPDLALTNNALVQLCLAADYKDWYVQHGRDPREYENAMALYDNYLSRHATDPRAVLGLAELIAVKGPNTQARKSPLCSQPASQLLQTAESLGAARADAPADIQDMYKHVADLIAGHH